MDEHDEQDFNAMLQDNVGENCSNSTSADRPRPGYASIPILTFQCFIVLLIIISNTVVIVSLVRERFFDDIKYWFITNLASADLLVGSILLFYAILDYNATFERLPILCTLVWTLLGAAVFCSVLNLIVVTADMYIRIQLPLHHKLLVTPWRAKATIAISWIVILGAAVVSVVATIDVRRKQEFLFCSITTFTSLAMSVLIFVAFDVLPVAILCFLFSKITITVRKHIRRTSIVKQLSATYSHKLPAKAEHRDSQKSVNESECEVQTEQVYTRQQKSDLFKGVQNDSFDQQSEKCNDPEAKGNTTEETLTPNVKNNSKSYLNFTDEERMEPHHTFSRLAKTVLLPTNMNEADIQLHLHPSSLNASTSVADATKEISQQGSEMSQTAAHTPTTTMIIKQQGQSANSSDSCTPAEIGGEQRSLPKRSSSLTPLVNFAKELKAVIMMLTVVIPFFTFYTVYHGAVLLIKAGIISYNVNLLLISGFLAVTNSFNNIVFYAWRSKELRQAFKKTLRLH